MILSMLFFNTAIEACSLWSVAGESSTNGGTIIAKNRDIDYPNFNGITLVKTSGYAYVDLSVGRYKDNLYVSGGGVNEMGLAVIRSGPPTYLDNLDAYSLDNLLKRYKTVDECLQALTDKKWTSTPFNFMLADKTKIAWIEFGPKGIYDIRETTSGKFVHTNHYLDKLSNLNPAIYNNSLKRFNRLNNLLNEQSSFDFEDFKRISADRIIRYNNGKYMTASSLVISQPTNGDAMIYAWVNNEDGTTAEEQYNLNDIFSGKQKIKSQGYR